MNELNKTLKEINVTIGFYKKKISVCEEVIEKLEAEKEKLLKKYDIPEEC